MAVSRARPAPRAPLHRNPLALTVAAGVAVAFVLVVASIVSSRPASHSAASSLGGIGLSLASVDGIPQDGLVLGSPAAPLTIEEYADLQCPYCQRFTTDVLPVVVDRYVRTGQAKLVFRALAFIGDDSVSSARLVLAAGRQDRLWQLVELLYRNQGAENTGWATAGLLRSAAVAAGLDGERAEAFAAGDASAAELQAAGDRATRFHVASTPTLVLLRSGRPAQVLTDLSDPTTLLATLAEALA